jgi:hypothetical protein
VTGQPRGSSVELGPRHGSSVVDERGLVAALARVLSEQLRQRAD